MQQIIVIDSDRLNRLVKALEAFESKIDVTINSLKSFDQNKQTLLHCEQIGAAHKRIIKDDIEYINKQINGPVNLDVYLKDDMSYDSILLTKIQALVNLTNK